MKRILTFLMVLSLPLALMAQLNVSGTVTDAETGNALAGANVVVEGTTLGAAADADGAFTINGVADGASVTASMIGYEDLTLTAAANLNFELTQGAIKLSALEVLASRADKSTPVAYTNVTKAEMEVRLGSQDIPMALNTTPSVYSTQQGGGAGDARINVRGFNQRNVAVMINGVPQNDMENGWVYWSNWDGVGDATSSIQMQRGLSAVNLATPSIGGTMNIITDPTALSRGGKFKQELGAGGFLKSTLNYNTGLIADKYAFSATLVRKTGDGIIDATWTDAWAYYFGASFQMDAANRFELYAIGAPQRHGQNLYKQNVLVYDKEFGESIVDKDILGENYDAYVNQYTNGEPEMGRYYNENVSSVSSDYKGKQYWYMYGEGGLFGGGLQDRYASDFLNERENFFHKPLVNLNHYLTINDAMRLSSILYWSGGSGGGTGTYGSVKWNYHAGIYSPSRWVHYDKTIANNSNVDSTFSDTEARSYGILRNSINRQNTYGLISKLNYDFSDALKLQAGIDWRTAGIEHTREVRDLLGGDYFVDLYYDNDGNPHMVNPNAEFGTKSYLGDNIDYHNETTVDWIGGFFQGNYTAGKLNAYGMFGVSSIAYTYQDHFTIADEVIEADAIMATQFKGGAMYDVNENLSAFVNFGLVEKPPIMDNVIYYDGTVASDPANEKFMSTEAGLNYTSDAFAAKVNVYNTDWIDRNLTKAVTTGQGSSGDTDVIFLTGVNQNHKGVEVEASTKLTDFLRLDFALSYGEWMFVEDAEGTYQDEAGNILGEYSYALKDLYVGDMPQTSYVFGFTLTPFAGLRAQVLMNTYDRNYADWGPDSREYDGTDEEASPDREQVWQAPGYSKMDLHLSYDLPDFMGYKLQAFAHVFNLTDAVFIQDAVDNSKYNGYKIYDENGNKVFANPHGASAAEVFLGTPRYFNAGLSVRF